MIQDNGAPKGDQGRLRKNIRNAFVAALKGKTDAGNNVFPNSTVPPWHEELPVILVYSRSESIDKYAIAPKEYRRTLDISVEIIASGPETDEDGNPPVDKTSLEDILDDIGEQVECEIEADETLRCNADETDLVNVDFEYAGEGGSPIGSLRLTYAVKYNTMAPRDSKKSEGIADFETAQVDFNIGEDENTRESKDTIDLTGG